MLPKISVSSVLDQDSSVQNYQRKQEAKEENNRRIGHVSSYVACETPGKMPYRKLKVSRGEL